VVGGNEAQEWGSGGWQPACGLNHCKCMPCTCCSHAARCPVSACEPDGSACMLLACCRLHLGMRAGCVRAELSAEQKVAEHVYFLGHRPGSSTPLTQTPCAHTCPPAGPLGVLQPPAGAGGLKGGRGGVWGGVRPHAQASGGLLPLWQGGCWCARVLRGHAEVSMAAGVGARPTAPSWWWPTMRHGPSWAISW